MILPFMILRNPGRGGFCKIMEGKIMVLSPQSETHRSRTSRDWGEEARKMPYITSVERLGREEGKKEGLVEGIAIALTLKFGDEGRKIIEELRAINDNALLGRILERIPEAKGLDELQKMAADG
jgi:hypothetical protein